MSVVEDMWYKGPTVHILTLSQTSHKVFHSRTRRHGLQTPCTAVDGRQQHPHTHITTLWKDLSVTTPVSHLLHRILFSGRTVSTGRDGVPNRPDAQRPQAETPRPANPFLGGFGAAGGGVGAGGVGAEGAGLGTLFGGQVHFQAGLGFFPSLFGLQFVSNARRFCVRNRVCCHDVDGCCRECYVSGADLDW